MTRLAAFDAEDSPGAEASRQPTDIHREERRFLIGSGQSQRQALQDRGVPFLRSYGVQTLYMEPGNANTWTIGKSQVKFRLRQYDERGPWWFEIKTNTAGMVDKHRRQVTPEQIDRLGLRPIVQVRYFREEYETGTDALDEYQMGNEGALTQWIRVTIDNGVTALQIPRNVSCSEAFYDAGRSLATLKNRVLEVKSGQNEVPPWLPRPGEWDGSKSRFAVAALYGQSNMWAPAYTLRAPARDDQDAA